MKFRYLILIILMTVILYGDGEKTYTGTLYLNSGTGASQISTDGTLATNADSTLVSEKAIKTYVDAEHDKVDTLNTAGDTGTGTINLETETITFSGTTNETNTIASGQTITIGLTDDVTITDTLTVGGSLNVTGDITGVFPDSLVTDILGTANEVEVTETAGNDYTIGLPDDVTITSDLTVGDTLGVGGAITGTTLDTGQGANELYDMNQNVQTTDDVTFNSVTTDTINSLSLYDVSPEGLVLGMNFNTETINGSDVYDASFYNNHGTINNATPDSSAGFNSGGAITFTGADTSYVEIPDAPSLDITEAITLMAWAKDPPAWLTGWDYRRKITIESDNIDATLTDFPLLIHLSGSCGSSSQDLTGIFDRIATNSKKIALTTSDGATQCYVEIEEWDNSNQEAWLWARIPSISSSADTDLYLYYDNAQADNDTYVGLTNSAPADSVWTNDYTAVYHLAESGTTCYDSSPNDNDGTKQAADNPDGVVGLIGYGQDFEESNVTVPYIDLGAPLIPADATFTVSAITKSESFSSSYSTIMAQNRFYDGGTHFFLIIEDSPLGRVVCRMGNVSGNGDALISGTWYINQLMANSAVTESYHNNNKILDFTGSVGLTQSYHTTLGVGSNHYNVEVFDGIIDEVRISSITRTTEWLSGNYYSQVDSLNTFATEEIESVTKLIIDKTSYSIYYNVTDSTFSGFVGIDVDYQYNNTDILDYHLYAMTYDKTSIILYLDGVQVAIQAYTTAITANDSVLTIGKSFAGEIDDISIYNRALSADEIWAYYANRVEVSDPYFSKNDDDVQMIGDLTVAGNINGTFPDSLSGSSNTLLGTENEITVTESPADTYTFKLDSDIFTLDANARVYVSGNNIYLGNQAGNGNTGNYGSFIGLQAGYSNSGDYGSFIGYRAGYNNTGNYGSFIGLQAGYSNSGDYGSFIGYRAGYNNTGDYSSFIGKYAGYSNTGNYGSFIGYRAGYNNTGHYGSFIGNYAGYNNTGHSGSFIGNYAGYNNTGHYGSFIGNYAGYNNTGDSGSFIGKYAGWDNSGDYGSFIGYRAGYYNKGHNNSGIGNYTLAYADSSYNTAIGYQASMGTSVAHFTFKNTTSLGANSMPTMSNQIMLGDTTVVEVKTYGAFVGDSLYTSGGAVITGTLDAPTLNTGQGDNELYAMNQDVETTSDVVFDEIEINNVITLADNLTVGSGTILHGTSFVSVVVSGCLATDYIFIANTKPSGALDILPLFVSCVADSFIVYTDNADTLATDIPFNWFRVAGN